MLLTAEQRSFLQDRGIDETDRKLHSVPIDLFGDEEKAYASEKKSFSFAANERPKQEPEYTDVNTLKEKLEYRNESLWRLQQYIQMKREAEFLEFSSKNKEEKNESAKDVERIKKKRDNDLAKRFLELSGRRVANQKVVNKNFKNPNNRKRVLQNADKKNTNLTQKNINEIKIKALKKNRSIT